MSVMFLNVELNRSAALSYVYLAASQGILYMPGVLNPVRYFVGGM